jgi:hypothetical protein
MSIMALPISLMAGESLQINANDGNLTREAWAAADLESKLAWRESMLLSPYYLQAERLSEGHIELKAAN